MHYYVDCLIPAYPCQSQLLAMPSLSGRGRVGLIGFVWEIYNSLHISYYFGLFSFPPFFPPLDGLSYCIGSIVG